MPGRHLYFFKFYFDKFKVLFNVILSTDCSHSITIKKIYQPKSRVDDGANYSVSTFLMEHKLRVVPFIVASVGRIIGAHTFQVTHLLQSSAR